MVGYGLHLIFLFSLLLLLLLFCSRRSALHFCWIWNLRKLVMSSLEISNQLTTISIQLKRRGSENTIEMNIPSWSKYWCLENRVQFSAANLFRDSDMKTRMSMTRNRNAWVVAHLLVTMFSVVITMWKDISPIIQGSVHSIVFTNCKTLWSCSYGSISGNMEDILRNSEGSIFK